MQNLTNDADTLRQHIQKQIYMRTNKKKLLYDRYMNNDTASAVLVLVGMRDTGKGAAPQPCIILNKRSESVRQPGDLCFPGGGPSPEKDRKMAKLLGLPFSPLTRWAYWMPWCSRRPVDAAKIPQLLATSLREAREEMGLKSRRVRFMGPLPPQKLKMFDRVIYPMVGWLTKQNKFTTNWEVDRIITIPIEDLLKPDHYARYHLDFSSELEAVTSRQVEEHPCFLHQRNGDRPDILWGATFRIVMTFLDWVFDFHPPEMDELTLVKGQLDQSYLTGK